MDTVTIDKKELRIVLSKVQKLTEEKKELEEEIQKLRTIQQTKRSSSRIEAPETTSGITQKFEIGGLSGYITAGEYDDGTLSQIFIIAGKAGTTIQGLCDAIAKVISISVQNGVPLTDICHALKDLEFFPSGPVKYDPNIRGAKSIADYISMWLTKNYVTRSAAKKEAKDIDTMKKVKIEASEPNPFEMCPVCKTQSLKPKAVGCDAQCVNCGYIDSRGCSF